jgi:hypothetical protein
MEWLDREGVDSLHGLRAAREEVKILRDECGRVFDVLTRITSEIDSVLARDSVSAVTAGQQLWAGVRRRAYQVALDSARASLPSPTGFAQDLDDDEEVESGAEVASHESDSQVTDGEDAALGPVRLDE